MRKNERSSLVFLIVVVCCFFISGKNHVFAVGAFPGAEGFGAETSGGRGGKAYLIDTLEDGTNLTGKTTLRDCTQDTRSYGKRTCIFHIGGTITITSALTITKPDITIAGETAPGGGIAIKGSGSAGSVITLDHTQNVILRYLRLRSGPTDDKAGTLEIFGSWNVIADHLSISWSIDENLAIMNSRNVTIQNSIVSEPLDCSVHYEGCHSKNFFGYYRIASNKETSDLDEIFENISVYNNLIAHAGDRNPRFRREETSKIKDRNIDVVNNVIYNFKGATSIESEYVNLVNNVYKYGPDSGSATAISTEGGNTYIAGNTGDGKATTATGDISSPNSFIKSSVLSAQAAYTKVLETAGATLPYRDPVDQRIIYEVTNTKGGIIDVPGEKLCNIAINGQNIIKNACPNSQKSRKFPTTQDYQAAGVQNPNLDTDGYPVLTQGTSPSDTDSDGIPDDWETAKGLNPTDQSDGAQLTPSGYSNLELYLHHKAGASSSDPTPSPTAPTTTVTADIAPLGNPNGKVDIFDYNLLLEQFGKTGATGFHPADIIKNGAVDIFDYNVLLQQFSP